MVSVTELKNAANEKRQRIIAGKHAKKQLERLAEDPSTRGLTLGEIRERDIDNFHLLKKSKGFKQYVFDRPNHAVFFHGQAMAKCMKKLGVDTLWKHSTEKNNRSLTPQEIAHYSLRVENEMADKDVSVERRETDVYPNREDMDKRGFYIYHGLEIVYFISSPRIIEASSAGGHIILAGEKKFVIETNAPETV
jgi:hypothetical protein